jgi:hypothetical protein
MVWHSGLQLACINMAPINDNPNALPADNSNRSLVRTAPQRRASQDAPRLALQRVPHRGPPRPATGAVVGRPQRPQVGSGWGLAVWHRHAVHQAPPKLLRRRPGQHSTPNVSTNFGGSATKSSWPCRSEPDPVRPKAQGHCSCNPHATAHGQQQCLQSRTEAMLVLEPLHDLGPQRDSWLKSAKAFTDQSKQDLHAAASGERDIAAELQLQTHLAKSI